MFPPLHATRRLAASLTLCAVLFGTMVATASSQVETLSTVPPAQTAATHPIETVALDKRPVLLAHHEGSLGGSQQLLTTGVSAVGGPHIKSLWGNLILSMATQQDPQIQQIAKKLGRLNGFVFTSVGLISGISLAQSIDGLVTLQDDPHPYHPPILGLIGSGLSVLSVTAQAAMGHHYKKQLVARQDELTHEVEHTLAHLKIDGVSEHVTLELTKLIGDEATQEFIGLWQAAHPP